MFRTDFPTAQKYLFDISFITKIHYYLNFSQKLKAERLMAQFLPSFLLCFWFQSRQDGVVISSVLFQRIAVSYTLHHTFIGNRQIRWSENWILDISRAWKPSAQFHPRCCRTTVFQWQRLILFWTQKDWWMWSNLF